MDEWSTEEKKPLSVEELKAESLKLRNLDTEVKHYDKIVSELKSEREVVRQNIIAMLIDSGLETFKAPGVGTVTVVTTPTVKTPKDAESKQKLFDFLMSKGEDVFYTYVGVNSRSLNSLYKLELEKSLAKGEMFDLPGVEQGENIVKLSLKKS